MFVFAPGLCPVLSIIFAFVTLLVFKCLFRYEAKEMGANRIKTLLYEGQRNNITFSFKSRITKHRKKADFKKPCSWRFALVPSSYFFSLSHIAIGPYRTECNNLQDLRAHEFKELNNFKNND